MSHSKAFPQQSKPGRNSHSSNRYVSVVFAHRRNTEVGGRTTSCWVILAGLGSSPSFHATRGHPVSPRQRPGAGGPNPFRINTKSSNGAWGGKSPHTATQFRDATRAFRQLLVFSRVIWRLMLMDKSVFSERLLADLNRSHCLSQRCFACF